MAANNPHPNAQAAVGMIVQVPLAELGLYSCAREIDDGHVEKLREVIADPAEIRAEPIEIYFDAMAPNVDPTKLGAYVVLNGAHRVEAMRTNDASASVPCLVIEKPSSADHSFLEATASNTRSETARTATFSDKVESMMAARDHLETGDVPITTVKMLRAAAAMKELTLPPFLRGSEAHQVFNTSRGLRTFTRAELSSRSESGLDTRPYECFLALSGRSIELSRLVNGEERQMYRSFGTVGPAVHFSSRDVSLVYAVLNVPRLLSTKKQGQLAVVLYMLVVAKLFTTTGGEDNSGVLGVTAVATGRPSKRAKKNADVITVRSAEFGQRSAWLKSPHNTSPKTRPAVVLAERIEHVIVAFDYIAARCGFPSTERMVFPILVWNGEVMQLSVLPAGRTRRVSAGLRWTLYGSKVVTAAVMGAGRISCVPSQSWAEEAADLNKVMALTAEADTQLRSLALTFIQEVWEAAADTAPQSRAAHSYEDFANLEAGEASDAMLPVIAKRALTRATALVLTPEAATPPAPASPSAPSETDKEASKSDAGAEAPTPLAGEDGTAGEDVDGAGTDAVVQTRSSGQDESDASVAGTGKPAGSNDGGAVGSEGNETGGGPSAGGSVAVRSVEAVGFIDSASFPWRLDCSGFESWLGFEKLLGKVQLVLTDPPYGVRSAARGSRGGSSAANPSPIEHDQLDTEQMGIAAEKIIQLLRPGGHAVVFCSVQQFPTWCSLLATGDRLKVDKMPMFFTKAPSSYYSFARISTTLVNCCEVAVHATKVASSFEIAEGMVNYKERLSTSRNRYAGWTNVVENAGALGVGERVYGRDATKSNSRKVAVRPEQKSVLLMQELVHRFSQPQDTVVDMFAGTASTAVACMTMPAGGFRRFAGCELEETCWEAACYRVKKEFALEVSRGNLQGCCGSDRDAVEEECRAVLAAGERSASSSQGMCPYKVGLPAHTPLPNHLVSYLATRWKDETLLSMDGVPPPEWPEQHNSLRLCEVWEELLAVDAACQGLRVGESGIPGADDGVFAVRSFTKGDVLCWYGGTFVYEDLSKMTSKYRERGPVGFGVTKGDFESRGLEIEIGEKGLDELTKVHITPALDSVWVVASKFCVGGKVNDPRVVTGTDRVSGGLEDRIANAQFVEERDIDTDALRSNPHICRVVALSDIGTGEEVLINYGNKYWT